MNTDLIQQLENIHKTAEQFILKNSSQGRVCASKEEIVKQLLQLMHLNAINEQNSVTIRNLK